MTRKTRTRAPHATSDGWTTLYVRDKVIPKGLPIARLTSPVVSDEFPRSKVRHSDKASNKDNRSR